jgi:serine/threonine protein kinase
VDREGLLRALRELDLVPPEVLGRHTAATADDNTADALARALVQDGKLTTYQAGALLQGKAQGLLIGRYLVLDKLGEGGMGVVFRARHRPTGRLVALKVLPPSLARDADAVQRFRREFRVASQLSHPNVVAAIEANEDRGVHYLTMEYVPGDDLNRLVASGGPMSVKLALHCVIQVARGLEAAHAQGIVHRDVKPGNVMIDPAGSVRLLDLGLARVIEASAGFGASEAGPLTRTGSFLGTVDYLAPEQAHDAKSVDGRADIYSLGCTLYFLLTGKPPFPGETVLKRLMGHQERPAPSLRPTRPEVPEALEQVYQRMMAKRPGDRPRTISEVILALEGCRATAREAGDVSVDLKEFARTALKRASLKKYRGPDASVFARPAPGAGGLTFDPDLRLEDLVGDYRDEDGHDDIPEDKLPPIAPRALSRTPRRRRSSASAAWAVAGALVGIGALGMAFWPRGDARVSGPAQAVKTAVGPSLTTISSSAPRFQPLFNGKDLSGWSGTIDSYEVKDGLLVCKPGKMGLIFETTERADFAVRVEFRLEAAGNGGLMLRYPGKGDPATDGMCEIAILDDSFPAHAKLDPRQHNGAAWGKVAAKPGHLKPLGEWNVQEVTVRGPRVEVRLNGAVILDADIGSVTEFANGRASHPGKDRTSGFFGLFDLRTNRQGAVFYRKVEIADLGGATGPAAAVVAALKRPLTLDLGEVPFEDALRAVQKATSGPGLPRGLPIFVNPKALAARGLTMKSPITLQARGATTQDALQDALGTMGLGLMLNDARVEIVTAAGAPSSSSPPSDVLFADDFGTPRADWSATTPQQLAENPSHRWGHRDGIYFDEVRAAGARFFGPLPGGPYDNFTCEVDGRIVGDNAASRGSMVVLLTGEERGLVVRIDGTGSLMVEPMWDRDGPGSGPWVGPIFHPAIKKGGGEFNRVRVRAAGRRVEIGVNGAPQVTLDFDRAVTPARVGLGVTCEAPLVRAEYDRVEITRWAPATDAPPAGDNDGDDEARKPIRITSGGGSVLPDGTWVFEGGNLKVLERTGPGSAHTQANLEEYPGSVWSNNRQLLWVGGKLGDSLSLALPVDRDGNYDVLARCTRSYDFGRIKFELDGKPLAGGNPIDFYSPNVVATDFAPIGFVTISGGRAILKLTAAGKNRGSSGYGLGLDEVRLVPVR